MSSSSETAEERKVGVDPKLLFPVKLWLLSWLPSQRNRWNSKTGLPMSDDKEDWVQLGERKHDPGCKEQVGSHTFNILLRCFPTDIWNRPNYRPFSWKEQFMFFYHEVFFENLEINERISSHACHVFLGLCSPRYSFTHASTLFKFVFPPLA